MRFLERAGGNYGRGGSLQEKSFVGAMWKIRRHFGDEGTLLGSLWELEALQKAIEHF